MFGFLAFNSIFYQSFITGELSSNTAGLIRWPAKLLIPIGFGLLILSGISHLIKCIGYLRGICANPMDVNNDKSAEQTLAEEILAIQQESQER